MSKPTVLGVWLLLHQRQHMAAHDRGINAIGHAEGAVHPDSGILRLQVAINEKFQRYARHADTINLYRIYVHVCLAISADSTYPYLYIMRATKQSKQWI